jgi:DNA-binding CsgD family transcriptional regulator
MERKVDVERKLASLTDLERRIVLLYAEGYSQQEIGERVGYSRRNIGNILENIAKSIVDNTLI